MQERSQRQLRVGEQLRHVLIECLAHGNFKDELLYHNTQNIIISEVRISPDLKNAGAYVHVLGGKDCKPIIKSMNGEAHTFRKFVWKNLSLKFMPKIRFKEDVSFENANNIEGILFKINKESEEKTESSSEDTSEEVSGDSE